MTSHQNDFPTVNTATKSDYEKIGVQVVEAKTQNGRWVFFYDNKSWQLGPAGMTSMALSPIAAGADRLLLIGTKLKNIQNPENGIKILFSEEYFPLCDVRMDFIENKYDGWLYSVHKINLNVPEGQQAWICSYMGFRYPEPPKTLYLKLES